MELLSDGNDDATGVQEVLLVVQHNWYTKFSNRIVIIPKAEEKATQYGHGFKLARHLEQQICTVSYSIGGSIEDCFNRSA